MTVSVTEGTVSGSTTMHLHSTGGWEYWGTTTVSVRLVAGTNTVVLGVAPGDTGGGELPNVDWMTVALNTDSAGLGIVCDALEGFKYFPHAADMLTPTSTVMADVRLCECEAIFQHLSRSLVSVCLVLDSHLVVIWLCRVRCAVRTTSCGTMASLRA